MKTTTFLASLAGIGLMASASVAKADELNYAIGYAAGSVPVVSAEAMAKYSAEHGGPAIKVFPMTLLSVPETSPGIRDKVVEMGFTAHGFYQAEYPNSNLPAEFGVLVTNATPPTDIIWAPSAMAGAITEYIMLECPDCQAEFAKEQQVYLSGQSSPAYALQCSKDTTTLADLKGMQMRTPSGYWARWVEAMGGVSVFMSATEAFNALSQGVVDCVVIHPGDLITVRLIDVVKSSTLGVPQGVYSAASVANVNIDAWRSLPADQRKVLLEAAAFMNAEMTIAASNLAVEAVEELKARGIPVLEPSADLKEATDKFIADMDAAVIAEYASQKGVTNVEAKVARIKELIEKWVVLTKDVKTSDDLMKLYMSEIVSKIDVDTYGM